ncbi:MAG: ribonucleotide-diphosphate reductase subunit alpha, partial [Chloroflexi bacterium]|nr:ribonucleotide-diphosphate reductase subunit alpha [Chloroflexota bacterium]
TIAPTGSISIIVGASSGIEPIFALAFEHTVGERRLQFLNPVFEHALQALGLAGTEVLDEVVKSGTVAHAPRVPEAVRRVFVTAHEVAPDWHVRMQAAFQRHIDNAVSKTVNLPHDATVDDVRRAFLLAYELGCLGITVYRDGSKQEQVLTRGRQEEKAAVPKAIKARPSAVRGVTYRVGTPLGTAFITVNQNGTGEPLEVFANVGKAGSDTAAVAEALGRLISLCLRLPSPMEPHERLQEVVEQLSGIGGGRPLGFGPQRVRSLPDALAQVLARHLGLVETPPVAEQMALPLDRVGDLCPECGNATFVYAEGCRKCYTCGYSEC